MREEIKLYKQIKKQERKYEKAGILERERIMKKTLKLKERLDFLTGKEK